MEIASPLPLSHNRAGSKRSYCPSPFLDTTDPSPFPGTKGDCSMAIDETNTFTNQPFKRRRFIQSDSNSAENSKSHFPIFAKASFSATSTHGSPSKFFNGFTNFLVKFNFENFWHFLKIDLSNFISKLFLVNVT